MGAIRAAECWPAGVQGVGAIYRLYRAGLLDSDDAVAVATDPDSGHSAVSVALINVHAAIRKARGFRLITARQGEALEQAAVGLPFPDRTWQLILKRAGVNDPDGAIKATCAAVDIKRTDALRAARLVSSMPDMVISTCAARSFVHSPRYPGHDPLLGQSREYVEGELLRWIFGSGRYQKYLWPLVSGEPEFDGINETVDRQATLRDRLAATLARMLQDPSVITQRLVSELSFLEEFETEVMLWHAVRQLSESKSKASVRPTRNQERRTREDVAIAHGYDGWASLASDLSDQKLFGAIPLNWVEDACTSLALAKA